MSKSTSKSNTVARIAAREGAAFPKAEAVAGRIATKRCRGYNHENAKAIADVNNEADPDWYYSPFPAHMARSAGFEVNGEPNGWAVMVEDEDGVSLGFL
mgnify:CR=1 FL=1|tara:strand:- start:1146 stop:1442 length:297 start_codon:yes stop_codon:yes gene_type:complete